uniref:Uncharacterized protein n=1 Tax=viral metagenome TaxID=1070528 RepID=A0A6M3LNR8_9ZZZZ
MRNYMVIGSSPIDEDCAQVGTDNYPEQSRKECRVFIAQLRRQFGTEPILTSLTIKTFPHDFGDYHEVVCYYEDEDEEARDYAYRLESKTPTRWDDEAKQELGLS